MDKLFVTGKGILAVDWGVESIGKRFESMGVENTSDNRRRYREMLFTTPGLSSYISGVIENEETVTQKSGGGVALPTTLSDVGIIPGVKVDRGLVEMPNFGEEKLSEGLDGLAKRLEEYQKLGIGFTKWRVVTKISDKTPTNTVIQANSLTLARYAAIVQSAGMVPIVEPETLMDGKHDAKRCGEVTELVIRKMFESLIDYKVDLSGLILKTNMVLPGKECGTKQSPSEVADPTVKVLLKTVSIGVGGVVFLSGGQESEEAIVNFNAICKLASKVPWKMTFSFERAMEEPTLLRWAGKDENIPDAQGVLLERARACSLASLGKYEGVLH